MLLFSHSSCVWLFETPGLQHARFPCPSLSPLNQWCHPTLTSSVAPFYSCPHSFPVSGSFAMNQLFTSGGQSIGVSVLTSVSHSKEYSGLISFRINCFDSLEPQFESISCLAQPSLWTSSYICAWLLKNNNFDYMNLCWQSSLSNF